MNKRDFFRAVQKCKKSNGNIDLLLYCCGLNVGVLSFGDNPNNEIKLMEVKQDTNKKQYLCYSDNSNIFIYIDDFEIYRIRKDI